jgi:hypothetical protein
LFSHPVKPEFVASAESSSEPVQNPTFSDLPAKPAGAKPPNPA